MFDLSKLSSLLGFKAKEIALSLSKLEVKVIHLKIFSFLFTCSKFASADVPFCVGKLCHKAEISLHVILAVRLIW